MHFCRAANFKFVFFYSSSLILYLTSVIGHTQEYFACMSDGSHHYSEGKPCTTQNHLQVAARPSRAARQRGSQHELDLPVHVLQ